MNTFYLVRHAHADWEPNKNRPLSAKGRQAAGRVADLLHHYPIGVIYSSPFLRALQTIAPLADRLDLAVQPAPELRERRLGSIPQDGFLAAVETTWRDPTFAYPGGESNAAAQRRGVALVGRLQAQYAGEHIVLSTHGNLLALILQHFDPSLDFEFWQSMTIPDIYTLSFNPAGEAVIARLWPGGGLL